MTIRTCRDQINLDGYSVPKNTPIHVHMYSLHNMLQDWGNPNAFDPNRWKKQDSHPRCPYSNLTSDNCINQDEHNTFDGVGFRNGELSYFPFSAGHRSCMGKEVSLQLLRAFLFCIATNFRFDCMEISKEEDHGISTSMSISPMLKESMKMKVSAINF